MDEYKSNSHRSKEGELKEERVVEKKIEKVVSGEVRQKKKNWAQKAFGSFIAEDAQNIKNYVLWDIMIPAFKSMIDDTVHMALYGHSNSGNRKSSSPVSKISYSNYYDRDHDRRYDRPVKSSTSYDYTDVVISNRGEAEEVLSRMDEILDRYGMVSVADFYDLVGVQGRYTDNKYGWTDLRNASVIRVRDGYIIKLPKALSID